MAKQPKTITQPSYERTGVCEGADIAKNLILKRGAAAGGVAVSAAVSDDFAGVTMEKMFLGKSQSYQHEGVAQVLSAGAITLHALVTSSATGKAAAAASTNLVLGKALTAAGGADELIEVELWKGRFAAP